MRRHTGGSRGTGPDGRRQERSAALRRCQVEVREVGLGDRGQLGLGGAGVNTPGRPSESVGSADGVRDGVRHITRMDSLSHAHADRVPRPEPHLHARYGKPEGA